MVVDVFNKTLEECLAHLSPEECLRLASVLQQQALQAIDPSVPKPGFDWMAVEGIAPGLLKEDAQDWVTRTRRASDALRERVWRGD